MATPDPASPAGGGAGAGARRTQPPSSRTMRRGDRGARRAVTGTGVPAIVGFGPTGRTPSYGRAASPGWAGRLADRAASRVALNSLPSYQFGQASPAASSRPTA